MADISSRIYIDVETRQAIANLKRLQSEFVKANQAFAKANFNSPAAIRSRADMFTRAMVNTKQFDTVYRDLTKTSQLFTNKLEKNNLSLRESFKYAVAGNRHLSKVFAKESGVLDRVVKDRVKTMSSRFIQLGHDISGATKGIQFKPATASLSNFAQTVAMAAERQAIMNKVIKQGSTGLINWGKNTQWAGRQLMVGFTMPLMYFGAIAGKTFMDLEKQAVRFKRVYGDLFTTPGETEKALKDIELLAKQFTKYGVAAEKTMKLAADAAATGKVGADLTAQVVEATRLAVLGGIEQDKALETTISLTSAFGIAADELAQKIDFLNAVENQTVTSLDDITTAIPKVAPVVKQLGGNVEDLAFFLTAMREGGINASEGANALKSGLASMINPTTKASKMLAGFGVNIKGVIEANKGNLRQTVVAFAQAIQGIEDPLNRARAIEQLFGKFQFARISALFDNITKGGNQASRVLELTAASVEELAILSERELKTVEDAVGTNFKEAVEKFKVSIAPIGKEFLKALTPVLQFLGKLFDKFNNLEEGPKKVISTLIVVFGLIAPVLLMTIGLFGNLIGNVVKVMFGFRNFQRTLMGQKQILRDMGLNTQYLTQEELEQEAMVRNLDTKHKMLTDTIMLEKGAIEALTKAYERLSLAMSRATGARPPGIPPVRKNKGGYIKGYADGVTFVPGPKGAGDVVPALLTPGEAVIPAQAAQDPRNKPVIEAMISGNVVRAALGNPNVGGIIARGAGFQGAGVQLSHATMPAASGSALHQQGVAMLSKQLQQLAALFPNAIRVVSNLVAELPLKVNQGLRKGMPIGEFAKGMDSRVGKFNQSAAAGGANLGDKNVRMSLLAFEEQVKKRTIAMAQGTADLKVTDAMFSQATKDTIDDFKRVEGSAKHVALALESQARQVGQVRLFLPQSTIRSGISSGQFTQQNGNTYYQGQQVGRDKGRPMDPINPKGGYRSTMKQPMSVEVTPGANKEKLMQNATEDASKYIARFRTIAASQSPSVGAQIAQGISIGAEPGMIAAGKRATLAFNRGLGIQSPPKWGFDDGDWIAEAVTSGTEKGMNKRSQRIRNAVAGTVDRATAAIKPVATQVLNKGREIGQSGVALGKEKVGGAVAKYDERQNAKRASNAKFMEAAERRYARTLDIASGIQHSASGAIKDKRASAEILAKTELNSATLEERVAAIRKELGASTREHIAITKRVAKAEIEFLKALIEDKQATTEETQARLLAARTALQQAAAGQQLTEETQRTKMSLRILASSMVKVNTGISNFATKATGGMMGLSMLTMFGSMLPGTIGEFSRKMTMFMMGLTAILMLLPALTTPLGLLTVIVGGTIAAMKYLSFRINRAGSKALELETSLGATADAISEMGKITKKVSASEIMDRRRATRTALVEDVPGKKSFGETFLNSQLGKQTYKKTGEAIATLGKGQAIDRLANSMATMVASGVMTPKQAKSVVEEIGLQMGNASFAIQTNAKLTSLMDPKGKNLLIEPMTLNVNLIADSQEKLQESIDSQMNQIVTLKDTLLSGKSALLGFTAAGAGVGAGAGALAGASMARTIGAAIGTVIAPGVGSAIGAVVGTLVGTIAGAVIGRRMEDQKRNELVASTGGSITGQFMLMEQQRKQMIDALTLQYEKQMAITKNEKERLKITQKYLQDTEKILEKTKASYKILDIFFKKQTPKKPKQDNNKKEPDPSAGFDPEKWQNAKNDEGNRRDVMNAMVKSSVELAKGAYKKDPALKAIVDGLQVNLDSLRNKRGVRDENTQKAVFQMNMLLANKIVDPVVAQSLFNMFGDDVKTLNKVLNYNIKFGSDFMNNFGLMMSLFSDTSEETQKTLALLFSGKDTNGNPISLEEAKETLDMYTKLGQLQDVYNLQFMIEYLTKNPAREEILESILKKVKNKDKLTIKFIIDILAKEGGMKVIDTKSANDFTKNFKEEQLEKWQELYAEIYESAVAGDARFKTWLADQEQFYARLGMTLAQAFGSNYMEVLTDMYTQMLVQTKFLENNMFATVTPTKTTGTGERSTLLDDLLKKLKLVQQAAIKATGGMRELIKVTSKKTKLNALDQYQGIVQQLVNNKNFKNVSANVIELIEGMDAEGMVDDLKEIGVEVDKLGKVKIIDPTKFQALITGFAKAGTGDLVANAIKDIDVLISKNQAINKLRRMGVDYATAAAIAENDAVAKDIANNTIKADKLQEVVDLQIKLNQLNKAQKLITDIAQADEFDKRVLAYGQIVTFLELQEKIMEASIVKQKKDNELVQKKNDFLLTEIQYMEDLVNEKYNNQIEALQTIYDINKNINDLQNKKLDIANALASGDISAATKAMSEYQTTRKNQTQQSQIDNLRSAQKLAIENIMIEGRTRKQIEEENRRMVLETAQLEKRVFLEQMELRKRTIEASGKGIGDGFTIEQLQAMSEIYSTLKDLGANPNDLGIVNQVKALIRGESGGISPIGKEIGTTLGSTVQTFKEQYLQQLNDAIKDTKAGQYNQAILDLNTTALGELTDAVNANTIALGGKTPVGPNGPIVTYDGITGPEDLIGMGSEAYPDYKLAPGPNGDRSQWMAPDVSPEDQRLAELAILTDSRYNTYNGVSAPAEMFGGLGNAMSMSTPEITRQFRASNIVADLQNKVNNFIEEADNLMNPVRPMIMTRSDRSDLERTFTQADYDYYASQTYLDGTPIYNPDDLQKPGDESDLYDWIPAEHLNKPSTFGWDIMDGLTSMLENIKSVVPITFPSLDNINFGTGDRSQWMSSGGMVMPKYFASGGYSRGTDTIPAMLSPGEYVVRKSAVDIIGQSNMEKINNGELPGSVYNYSLSVNVDNSNANPNDIARTVIAEIKRIDSQRVRGIR